MKRILIAVAVFAVAASASWAQVGNVYSNTTTQTGFFVAPGGAAADPSLPANTITRLLADDITANTSFGLQIGRFDFAVFNSNTVAVSARPRIRFWDNDGAGGAPGTYLGGFTFNAISFAASTGSAFFTSNFAGAGLFTIPADGTFWVGMTFDNNSGATGATVAQLNGLGLLTFDPPTVGSSADQDFLTTANGSFLVNNPAGTVRNSPFGGAPVANYFYSFTAIPEPTTWALLGLGACGALPAYRRWRAGKLAKDQAASFYENKA